VASNQLAEWYRVLDVSPTASAEETRSAYRLLVNVWHPDRFAGDPRLQGRATDKLKAINEAYRGIKAARSGRGAAVAAGSAGVTSPRARGASASALLGLEVTVAEPALAAAVWTTMSPHPTLLGERPRIALAALVWGRCLATHEADRLELLLRMEDAAAGLVSGAAVLELGTLDVAVSRPVPSRVWPRTLVSVDEIRSAARPMSQRFVLEGVTLPRLGTLSEGRSGEDHSAALALALVPLASLCNEIRESERRLLGQVLARVDEYYASPSETFTEGSESLALLRSLHLLDPLTPPFPA